MESQSVAQEQLKDFIRSLPPELRRERRGQIDQLQGNLTKSMRTLRDISGRESRASTAASSGGRSVQSARSTPSARARRENVPQEAYYQNLRSGDQTRREGAFQPPSRRSSQQSSPQFAQFAPSRTPPGAQMAQPPQRWSRGASADNLNFPDYQRGDRSPGSARGSARGDPGRLGSARGSARDSDSGVSVSTFSGCSTPIAGRTWGHLTRQFGNGVGKQHYAMKSHMTGFLAENDTPGQHGKPLDDDMQSGLERCIGHGRRFLGGEKCHLQGALPHSEDFPGLHGHYKGDDFQGGIERFVGCGLKKYDRSEYHRHHISDDVESEPGLHGHTRDFDYKDGMEWYIGHGKRRVEPGHHKETWRATSSEGGRTPRQCHTEYPPAGLSTRDIAITRLARDPSRQGTHQDRRSKRVMRKDQTCNIGNMIQ